MSDKGSCAYNFIGPGKVEMTNDQRESPRDDTGKPPVVWMRVDAVKYRKLVEAARELCYEVDSYGEESCTWPNVMEQARMLRTALAKVKEVTP